MPVETGSVWDMGLEEGSCLAWLLRGSRWWRGEGWVKPLCAGLPPRPKPALRSALCVRAFCCLLQKLIWVIWAFPLKEEVLTVVPLVIPGILRWKGTNSESSFLSVLPCPAQGCVVGLRLVMFWADYAALGNFSHLEKLMSRGILFLWCALISVILENNSLPLWVMKIVLTLYSSWSGNVS